MTRTDRQPAPILGILTLILSAGPAVWGQVCPQPQFAPGVTYTTGGSSQDVQMGDLDGDGDLDLAVARSAGAVVLLNNGSGGFGNAVTYGGVGDSAEAITIANLNPSVDAHPDLALANAGSDDVEVLFGNGDGTFGGATLYPVGAKPQAIVSAELNGQPGDDIATGDTFNGAASVLLNNGDGTFAPNVLYGTGTFPEGIAAADLNNDSDIDLVVTNGGGSSFTVLRNSGTGSFSFGGNTSAGSQPWGVALGDLDGDADPDVAVANRGGDVVTVFMNSGSGSFGAGTAYPAGEEAYNVAIGDLNNDAKTDLAVVNRAADTLSILLGNGNGTFGSQHVFPTGDDPQGVAVGDLDGDSDLDVAVANWAAGTVTVYINTCLAAINVEVDWLVAAGDHDHRPADCELDAVIEAFARHGITLNIEMSDAIPETPELEVIDFFWPDEFEFDEWADLEAVHRDHPPGTGWHYMIFAHNYSYDGNFTTSSGLAELPGDEFVVTLGSFGVVGSPWERAATFMHEFGHNLGLRHSGNQNENVVRQYKPNYASVMSYRYQLIGVQNGMSCTGLATSPVPVFHLDYSDGVHFPDLQENLLDEDDGIGYGGVDWDCSGGIGGSAPKDVSSDRDWCPATGPRTLLKDYDDWSNLVSIAGSGGGGFSSTAGETVRCMTPDDVAQGFLGCAQVDPCNVDQECGNGVIDLAQGEVCDGTTLGVQTCETLGYLGGTLACKMTCREFETSGCTSMCGDDMIHTGEVCDGEQLGGETCEGLNFTGGTLGCNPSCDGFDTSACTFGCGDNIASPNEVCDGADLQDRDCAFYGFGGGTLACDPSCDFFDFSGCLPAQSGVVPADVALALGSPGNLEIQWTPSACAGAVTYAVYEGTVGSWYSHAVLDCEVVSGGEITPGAGNRYYLVVPQNAAGEGSYGVDSGATERPVAGLPCASPQYLGCP